MLDQEWGQSHPTAEFTEALAREITALMEFSSDDASDEASPQPTFNPGRPSLYHIEPVFSLADPIGPCSPAKSDIQPDQCSISQLLTPSEPRQAAQAACFTPWPPQLTSSTVQAASAAAGGHPAIPIVCLQSAPICICTAPRAAYHLSQPGASQLSQPAEQQIGHTALSAAICRLASLAPATDHEELAAVYAAQWSVWCRSLATQLPSRSRLPA